MGESIRMSIRRLSAIVRKEALHIVRDGRNLFLVTLSPAFLLFLLGHVFSFEAGQFQVAVLDLDRSPLSRRYLSFLGSDQDLILGRTVERQADILPLLLAGQVDAGLVIPPGFSAELLRGEPAQVQAIIDGTDPFVGRQAASALETRSAVFAVESGSGGRRPAGRGVELRSQALYNAGLTSQWSMVPGLLAIVLTMPNLAFALALAREKESGTLENLVATPIRGLEYLGGKLLAYVLAGLVSAALALAVATLYFKAPFRGSLAVYLLLSTTYFLACMGASLVIAHFVRSQQTAMFVVLLVFIVPSFFLSGLISPVGTDSLRSMLTSYALPSTHFVEICRAVFLKGLGLSPLRQPAGILLGMGTGATALGLALFRKKVA